MAVKSGVAEALAEAYMRELKKQGLFKMDYENIIIGQGMPGIIFDDLPTGQYGEPYKKIAEDEIDITPLPAKTTQHQGLKGFEDYIKDIAKSGVNEERVKEIVHESIKHIQPKILEFKFATGDTKKIEGLTHYQLPLVVIAIGAGVNLALSGSTATSKTTMAVQSAKALDRPYFVQPVNEGTTKADILGYCTATGDYVPSLLHRAMKDGAILIVEEIDSGSPASLLAFNNAVDNRELTFPNGETVQAHEKFGVVCTMNTKGIGADRKFVGRNRLDAATLDRFCILEVERDLSLEAAIIGVHENQAELKLEHGGRPNATQWLKQVRGKREEFSRSHPDKIVSMRAVRDGWKLLNAGVGLTWTMKMCVIK
jgi:hypothetical protein